MSPKKLWFNPRYVHGKSKSFCVANCVGVVCWLEEVGFTISVVNPRVLNSLGAGAGTHMQLN